MAKHHFYLQADWPGKRNDIGRIESGNLKTEISIPKEMDGPGAGTNPDEMLLGAAATCYIITLAAMMERSGLEKESLTMESEAVVDVTGGVFTYEKIIHRPLIRLPKEAAEKEVELAERLAEKAETSCMISRAVQGNVAIELEAKIVVSKAD
ncbi:OsmC family protein [Bacillus haynesii]|uniref:Peroxiredoxin n=1 Tax=Bacillus haynesii TaxID=1925021 RepID=A0ABX3I3Y4_9BACI|nr:OsmC family protein [Bacillus haynesii]NVB33282.1 OsmC family protein [Bacillus licheniformis]MBU8682289.1 OsmC family protein [Bacillus haynesii]MCI4126196.1 OsmC family protein [Bacillus haynesii]MCY7779584.1 OsmC family protein [Bacillus haynesii]MCY7801352.1 OsmC family protein [Bacillus haynesii]